MDLVLDGGALRQILSLLVLTNLGAAVLYLGLGAISYFCVFDHALKKHPHFLQNQVRREIRYALTSLPCISVPTVALFFAEVRGYSRLYDRWTGFFVSVISFLFFTDMCIYWIHRFLHHRSIYKVNCLKCWHSVGFKPIKLSLKIWTSLFVSPVSCFLFLPPFSPKIFHFSPLNSVMSDSLTLNTVLPQGCILSPLLFSVYTNEIRYDTNNLTLIKYADDMALFARLTNTHYVNSTLCKLNTM
uniref:Sterol-C5-desaturase n=1 Tax=Neogobius melanostomus TaxID=47308 RepID=A0A8C6SFQ6_9GOBI